jgi:two-component system NtrC family response regulator
MAYSILILDDDVDFNSLLTDIYEQADYIVTSVTDPVEAIEVFRETDYDLVVTDHKMPEMMGSDFMVEIKRHKPQIPVIMVSGYLENDTIRELIRDGVGGVFLKPLNIFSLLERTQELVEEAKRVENSSSESVGGPAGAESVNSPGFPFRSFPCKSGASTAFAERLHNLRNFKSTLSLIGEPGTHYRRICEDIRSFNEGSGEQFIYLSAGTFDEVQTLSLIAKAQKEDARRITFVLLEFEAMEDVQKELAVRLAKHEDPFDGLDIEMRTVFCLSRDLDSLFDDEQIDESLYILMGTAEVRVPPLRECQADIGVMAQQLLMEIAREKSMATVPPLEGVARDLFRQYPWKRNFSELSEIIRIIIDDNQGDSISVEAVKAAIEGGRAEPLRARLKSFLEAQQTDYLRAASILCAGDRRRIAELFDTNVSTIESKME